MAESAELEITDILRNAHHLFNQIRKSVAAGGHIEALFDLDSLLSMATEEARRRLADIERGR